MTTKRVSRFQSRHLSERVVHYFKPFVNEDVTEAVRHLAAESFSIETLYRFRKNVF